MNKIETISSEILSLVGGGDEFENLQKIIAKEDSLLTEKGRAFAENMVKAILAASPQEGNFWKTLDLFKDARSLSFHLGGDSKPNRYGQILLDPEVPSRYLVAVRYESRTLVPMYAACLRASKTNELSEKLDSLFRMSSDNDSGGDEAESWKIDWLCLARDSNGKLQRIENTDQNALKLVLRRISRNEQQEVDIILHSDKRHLEDICSYLEVLWDCILSTADKMEVARKLAEFEFVFYTSNPLGRGGASIGDAMVISLQKKLGIPIRSHYKHQDFDVLSAQDIDSYITGRYSDFLEG